VVRVVGVDAGPDRQPGHLPLPARLVLEPVLANFNDFEAALGGQIETAAVVADGA
jgi:hypothetical protein